MIMGSRSARGAQGSTLGAGFRSSIGDLTGRRAPRYVACKVAKRTVTLDIAGAKYRMTSDADEAHLRQLAEMVDERIQALGSKALRAASPAQLLAVVALGLADDLLVADKRRDQLERLTREAIDRAIERIDSRLEEDAELAKKAE